MLSRLCNIKNPKVLVVYDKIKVEHIVMHNNQNNYLFASKEQKYRERMDVFAKNYVVINNASTDGLENFIIMQI